MDLGRSNNPAGYILSRSVSQFEVRGQRNMSRIVPIWVLALVVVLGVILFGQPLQAQTYSLPNVSSQCPSGCRLVQWKAGSDLWNNGTLPNYSASTCGGLAGDGKTNDGPAIQTCINNAASNSAVLLPSGTYFVNSVVRLKSNVALRGTGPTTNINLGSGGQLTTQNWSYSTNLNPTVSYGCFSSCPPFNLSGTPQKDDTTITIGTGSVSVGSWVSIFGNDDPSLISTNGTDGFCQWCGWNQGYYVQQQIVQVTGFVSGSGGPGTVASISRPWYYTPYTKAVSNPSGQAGITEPAGAKYRVVTFPTQKAGFEYFHVTATQDVGGGQIVYLQGCLYCWVKGVETQNTGSNSGSAHVELDWSYGDEIRDGYYHEQRSGASGSGYGVYLQFVNSDHKIENNTMRHNRHGFVFQGGGSGVVFLYNYIDDLYTDDTSYLGSARTSHGAHPFMNLFEGNVASHITADDFSGTTSHDVFFRNWLWGDETMNWSGAVAPTGNPGGGFDPVDLYQSQQYYSYVGNVLGRTGLHATWSAATLTSTCSTNNCAYDEPSTPAIYSTGSSQLGSAGTSAGTILRHGNWDYKTNGVAFWDGGANHALASSLYYSSQPSFLSGNSWPLEGPEGNPTINANPAENCYLSGPAAGRQFDPSSCFKSGAGTVSTPPQPPSKLTATVN